MYQTSIRAACPDGRELRPFRAVRPSWRLPFARWSDTGATSPVHEPVLLGAVLQGLAVRADGVYADATYGRGGHAAAILERLGREGRLLALDRDPEAVAAARARFAGDSRVQVVASPFSHLAGEIAEAGSGPADGILLDLGVSSPQLDDPTRGFSFTRDGPLDMRMDPEAGLSAASWIATAREREIANVIRRYGEERFARRIARAIVEARSRQPIERTRELADIVAAAVPGRDPKRHPATRTFQAIRIFVNRELEELEACLAGIPEVLAPSGRLCVISFHSLEDRIAKRFIRRQSRVAEFFAGLPEAHIPPEARPRLAPVGKALRPDDDEVRRNPRARSAVLRVAERLAQ